MLSKSTYWVIALIGLSLSVAYANTTKFEKVPVRLMDASILYDASIAVILYGEDEPQYEANSPFRNSARWLWGTLQRWGFPEGNIILRQVRSPKEVDEAMAQAEQMARECKIPRVVVAYIGHGEKQNDKGYLALRPNASESYYPMDKLAAWFERLPAKHKWLLLDACYAGYLEQEYLRSAAGGDRRSINCATAWLSSAPDREALTSIHRTKLIDALDIAISQYTNRNPEFREVWLSDLVLLVKSKLGGGRFGAWRGGFGDDMVISASPLSGPSKIMSTMSLGINLTQFDQESVRQRIKLLREQLLSPHLSPPERAFLAMLLAESLRHRRGTERLETLLEARSILSNSQLYQSLGTPDYEFRWQTLFIEVLLELVDFEGLPTCRLALRVAEKLTFTGKVSEAYKHWYTGIVLVDLGNLLSTQHHIRQAIDRFEDALKFFTEQEYPQEWASLKMLLCAAHLAWANCETSFQSREQYLRYAEANAEILLKVFSRQEYSLKSAIVQVLLGLIYLKLPPQQLPEHRLEKVKKHLVNAIEVFAQQGHHDNKAFAELVLGFVHFQLAMHGSRAQYMESAKQYFQNSLKIFTEQEYPRYWATIQIVLGGLSEKMASYQLAGERQRYLQQAITSYENALRVFTVQGYPHQWADVQMLLGILYINAAYFHSPQAYLEKAKQHFQNALRVWTKKEYPQRWANIQQYLGIVNTELANHQSCADCLKTGILHFHHALEVYTERDYSEDWAGIQVNLGVAYFRLAQYEKSNLHLEQSIKYFERALVVYTEQEYLEGWALTQSNLGSAYFTLFSWTRISDYRQKAAHALQSARKGYERLKQPERVAEIDELLKQLDRRD